MSRPSIPRAVAEVRAWLNNEGWPAPFDAIGLLADYAWRATVGYKAPDFDEILARLSAATNQPLDLKQIPKGWVSPERHYARVDELIRANNVLVAKYRALKSGDKVA